MMQARPLVHVVDDDPIVRGEAAQVLMHVGYDVELYEGAESFLAGLTGRAQPECLLLDVRMSGMSGLGLQERLQQLQVRIPIVFLTSHADAGTVVHAMKSGAHDFLEKPIHKQTLIRVVQEALDKDAKRTQQSREVEQLRSRLQTLSCRERDVLDLLVAGKNTKEISRALRIGLQTVAKHRAHTLEKMLARSVVELVRCLASMLPDEFKSIETHCTITQ